MSYVETWLLPYHAKRRMVYVTAYKVHRPDYMMLHCATIKENLPQNYVAWEMCRTAHAAHTGPCPARALASISPTFSRLCHRSCCASFPLGLESIGSRHREHMFQKPARKSLHVGRKLSSVHRERARYCRPVTELSPSVGERDIRYPREPAVLHITQQQRLR